MSLSKRLIDSAKIFLPDDVYLSFVHRRRIGRFPNLKRPLTFNEQILRRCLHPDPRYVDLSDKLAVRDFIAKKIGPKYLIPLIAEPETFTRSVFDQLPSQFVMKANHGSGFVKVVRDKKDTTFEELAALAETWRTTDFYKIARERHYRTIKPRVYFEKLLLDDNGVVPADLKFHVFNEKSGKQTIYILVISDRFGKTPHGDVFDVNWNVQNIAFGHYTPSEEPVPRPKNLDELLSVADALAKDFEYVRVDLYSRNNDEIFFGELTFTPGAGVLRMRPDSADYEWGRLLEMTRRSSRSEA
jgi:hypothetical protein